MPRVDLRSRKLLVLCVCASCSQVWCKMLLEQKFDLSTAEMRAALLYHVIVYFKMTFMRTSHMPLVFMHLIRGGFHSRAVGTLSAPIDAQMETLPAR